MTNIFLTIKIVSVIILKDKNGKFYKPERGSGNYPDHIMLSFCGDAKHSMAVCWRTDITVKTGYLLLENENGEEVRIDSENREYESDIDISINHTVIINNLESGKKYCYTVGSEEYRSEKYTFITEEEKIDKFSFLVITDHQKGNPVHCPDYSMVGRLLKRALSEHPECRFIFTVGDNCDNGQNELQWNGMFEGLRGIIESIPYMMTTGNHDNRGFISYFPEPTGKFYLDHADFFDFQFKYAFPQNGPKGFETENYSFDYGNAHFTVMGINAPETVSVWAYDDMQKSDKTWKLASYHFPIYPVMPEGQNDDGYPSLRKAVEEGRPDVMFAGHEHSFARTFPTLKDELFDKPSEGVVHYIAGNAGGNIYHSNAQKVWHSAFFPQEERMGLYTLVDIDKNVLTATAYMEDGRIVDKMIIDKNTDTLYPYALAPVYDYTKMCFKGRMLELSAREHYAKKVDGIWFAPLGIVIQSIGGKVIKEENSLICEAYKHKAEFINGSKTAHTDMGSVEMIASPFFEKGQLYVPVDDTAKMFELSWYYAERNNYINWNTPHEDKPLYAHPGR